MKKTKKTLRKLPPLARALAALGNDADNISRRAHRLSAIAAGKELDSSALQAYMATITEEEN